MDVKKQIAAPTVGGMLTSTVLALAVIPAVNSLWRERELVFATPRPEDESQKIRREEPRIAISIGNTL